MSLSYSQMTPVTASNDVTVKADSTVMSLILAVSVGLIVFGMFETLKPNCDNGRTSPF
jgi:hypothetical protein